MDGRLNELGTTYNTEGWQKLWPLTGTEDKEKSTRPILRSRNVICAESNSMHILQGIAAARSLLMPPQNSTKNQIVDHSRLPHLWILYLHQGRHIASTNHVPRTSWCLAASKEQGRQELFCFKLLPLVNKQDDVDAMNTMLCDGYFVSYYGIKSIPVNIGRQMTTTRSTPIVKGKPGLQLCIN